MYDNKLKKIIATVALAAACAPNIFAESVIGMNASVSTFDNNITAKAYDRTTGTFYVATDTANGFASAGATADNFTSLVPTGATAGDFVVVANAGPTASATLNKFLPTSLMSLVNGTSSNWLPALQGTTLSVFNGTTAAARQVMGNNFLLADATTPMTTVSATSVNRLAAGTATVNDVKTGKAFAYVVETQAAPGATNDGVCSANIDLGTGAPTATAADLGLGSARKLNAVDGITAAGSYLGFRAAGAGVATTNGGWVNDLYWDNELSVLYAGVSTWMPSVSGDVSNGLVMSTLHTTTGGVQAFTRADGTTLTDGPSAAATPGSTIFAAKQDGTNWTPGAATIVRKIRGMHTSTDFKYLILDSVVTNTGSANIGSLTTNVNTVYAVRVAKEAGTNIVPGQVVKKSQTTNGADIALGNNWTAADLGATVVGAGALPFDYAGKQFVTDMEVIGDAVYASVGIRAGSAGIRSAINDIGVFVSHALFDNKGLIQGWTPWERVVASAVVADSTATPADLDATSFFEVDGARGMIWQVVKDSSAQPRIVNRTVYNFVDAGTDASTSLPARLNKDLENGCTAVLDLPTLTPGIGTSGNASNSFALFGGNETVVFAQTKSGSANLITADFSAAASYLVTELPDGAGYVRSLGYSRSVTAAQGYFFAGTNKGLYVLVPVKGTAVGGQAGFDASTGLTTLAAAPFAATPGWLKMPTLTGDENEITGAVVAIEANGTYLFVVEQQPAGVDGFVSKLHRFTIGATNDGTANATNHIVIAQSGENNIPEYAIFTGFSIVSLTGLRASADWGILTTNGGAFLSGVVLNNVTATTAWTAMDSTKAYTLLKPIKRIPAVGTSATNDGMAMGAMFSSFASAENNNIWQSSALFNTGLVLDTTNSTTANNILPFNNAAVTSESSYLLGGTGKSYLAPIVQIWTDGGRRIGIGNGSQPYFTSEWNMTAPYDIFSAFGEVGITNIFWQENISGLGLTMGGSDMGVITLG